MDYFCQNNTFLSKNISQRGFIYLNIHYLSIKFPNSLCHFRNNKSFFTAQLLCVFLAQTSHTSYKKCLYFIKVHVFRIFTTCVKIRQAPHVIFHTKIQFFFKIWINLECYDITPLYFLGSNILYFRQKQHIKVQIFRLATARIKIHQIPYIIFGTQSTFFFKLCITLHCHEI